MKQLTITGTATQPEHKEQNGKSWVQFNIEEVINTQNGGKFTESTIIIASYTHAKTAEEKVHAGATVLVQGKPSVRAYISDKSGKAYAKTTIYATTIEVLANKADEYVHEENQQSNGDNYGKSYPNADEVPF
jgi:hypothetical protein